MSETKSPAPTLRKIILAIRAIENAQTLGGTALLGLGTRIVFASVLLKFFWTSAMTKVDGFGLSFNAYAQIFPKKMEALGYDPTLLSAPYHLIAGLGTIAEFALPFLVLIGLFTRLSSVAMLGFITVMTLTDIYGHGIGAETIGAAFDRFPDAAIADQRLLWVWLLVVLIVTGGGRFSVDRLILGGSLSRQN